MIFRVPWWVDWRRRRWRDMHRDSSGLPADDPDTRQAIEQRQRADRARQRAKEQGERVTQLSDAFADEFRRALRGGHR